MAKAANGRAWVAERISHIAGLGDDPEYARGERGGSAAAAALRRLAEGLELSGLTGAQLDHLARVLCGALSAVQGEWLRRHFHVRPWRKGGPGMERFGIYRQGWMDHLSRLVSRETGAVTFRSEPYRLGGEELRQLVALLDAGWLVRVRADHSEHFPGWTTAVLVSRARPEGRPP
jgi:hypothetical protein